jgi:hypothetical protein
MKRIRALLVVMLLAGALLLGLSACGIRGEDGKAYLALDWTYTPQTVYFPMLPPVISAGTYYEHPAGTYYGEDTAWNWDFYSFYYTLEINEGTYGTGMWPGEDGADRFYSMFLSSWGPELYYFEDRSRSSNEAESSLAEAAAKAETAAKESSRSSGYTGGAPSRERTITGEKRSLDPERYDLDNPEEFVLEKSGPGWRLTVEGLHYPALER